MITYKMYVIVDKQGQPKSDCKTAQIEKAADSLFSCFKISGFKGSTSQSLILASFVEFIS